MVVVACGRTVRPLRYNQPHRHSHWETILNLEGTGTGFVGETSYVFSPGSILCVPPGVPHGKTSVLPFQDIYIEHTAFPNLHSQGILHLSDDSQQQIRLLFHILHQEFQQKAPGYRRVVDGLSAAIEALLLRYSGSPPGNPYVEQLRQQLVARFQDADFSLSSAMRPIPLCRDHLRRLFLKEMGMTPLQYLTHLRLSHARELLSCLSPRGRSMEEIAAACGFSDAQYFCRLFKQHTGYTPSDYARFNAAYYPSE